MISAECKEFGVVVSRCGGEERTDGVPYATFADLGQALAAVAERHAGEAPSIRPVTARDRIDIVAVAPSNSALRVPDKPRYHFYIDPLAGDEANGSHTAPWPSLDAAIAGMSALREGGELRLDSGQSLRVSIRDVFVATPIEESKRRVEAIAKYTFMMMTLLLVIPVFLILGHLLIKAWPALSLSFIIDNPQMNNSAGGLWAPLIGTVYLIVISLAIAAPVGVLAGVYLNEYAPDNWFNRIVNLAVVNLAGVPSIVHALFGVGAFVLFARMGQSVMAASCTLAIMTLPVIITSTREALASVPMPFREACWNLGASRWQTIRTIVLPNSISGILTGVILQVSRAAGETAPILFTGAAYSVFVPDHGLKSIFPYGLWDSCMALSYHLYIMMTQVRSASAADIAAGKALPLEQLQYGAAVVLIGLVLAVNSLSIGLRVYLRTRKKW